MHISPTWAAKTKLCSVKIKEIYCQLFNNLMFQSLFPFVCPEPSDLKWVTNEMFSNMGPSSVVFSYFKTVGYKIFSKSLSKRTLIDWIMCRVSYWQLIRNSLIYWNPIFVQKYHQISQNLALIMCFVTGNLESWFPRINFTDVANMPPNITKFIELVPISRVCLLPTVQQFNDCS